MFQVSSGGAVQCGLINCCELLGTRIRYQSLPIESAMSSRRAMSMPPAAYERPPKKRNRCTSCICMSWKVFSVIFSYVALVTLVVAYCMFGAYMFSYLESRNELDVSGFRLSA